MSNKLIYMFQLLVFEQHTYFLMYVFLAINRINFDLRVLCIYFICNFYFLKQHDRIQVDVIK